MDFFDKANGKISPNIYDSRDDFNIIIDNFPFQEVVPQPHFNCVNILRCIYCHYKMTCTKDFWNLNLLWIGVYIVEGYWL